MERVRSVARLPAARDLGLLIRPLGDVLVVMPALSITLPELDRMLDVMIECTRAITEET